MREYHFSCGCVWTREDYKKRFKWGSKNGIKCPTHGAPVDHVLASCKICGEMSPVGFRSPVVLCQNCKDTSPARWRQAIEKKRRTLGTPPPPRVGLPDSEYAHTLQEIADEIGTSRERARQIMQQALTNARLAYKALYPDTYADFEGGVDFPDTRGQTP